MGPVVERRRLQPCGRRRRPTCRARSGRRGARLGRRRRRGSSVHRAGTPGRRGPCRSDAGAARRRAGRSRRHPPPDAAGDRDRGAGTGPVACRLHADLFRLRPGGHRGAPARLRRVAPDHGGRVPAARLDRAAQGRRRRGRGRRALRRRAPSWCDASATERLPRRGIRARDRWWDEEMAAPPGEVPRPPARRSGVPRPTRNCPTWSSTRPARPDGRRAPSTSTAASRSRRAQDLAHSFDLNAGDTLFWFTDLGWMMGPWAISGALILGARLVLLRGHPRPSRPGPPVGHRRAASGHAPRPQPDGDSRADPARDRPGHLARSVVAAGPGLHRRALESRPLVVVLPGGRRIPLPDHQLQRRHGGLGRHRLGQPHHADATDIVWRPNVGRRRRCR